MPLSDRRIRSLLPSGKTYKAYDKDGLLIQVTPQGCKTWYYRYFIGGKDKKIKIGTYPIVSLADARDRAIDMRRMVLAGTDPMTPRRAEKQREAATRINTLMAVIEEWERLYCGEMAERTRQAHARNIRYIGAYFGNRPVAELTTPELFEFIVRARDKRGSHVAGAVLSVISRSLQHAVLRGLIAFNPARELSGAVPRQKAVNRPALPVGQIGAFLRNLEQYRKIHTFTRLALELLMLTFVRPGELCGAEWAEIDLKARRWVIPASRMKMRQEHVVPLSSQAAGILAALHKLSGRSRYVFPSSGKQRCLAPNTLNQAMHRMCYRGIACPHGFRALASSTLNENGFRPDVIERQLAHSETNKIRAAYNRAEYLDERAQMMQWWADFIDEQRRK